MKATTIAYRLLTLLLTAVLALGLLPVPTAEAKTVAEWLEGYKTGKDWFGDGYKYDITDLVAPGQPATVVALVRNDVPSRNGQTSWCHRWGGLYRDVELEATPSTWIDNAWVEGDFDRREAAVHVSNVMLFNPFTKKGDRTGFRVLDDGRKVRYFKSNNEVVDV